MDDFFQLILFALITSVIFALVEKNKNKSFFKNFIQNFLICALIFIACNILIKFFNIHIPSDRNGSSMLVIIVLLTIITLVKFIKKR